MFSFFAPKCPIDLWRKTWIEWRWKWLGEQFGWDKMLQCKVFHPEDIPHSKQSKLSHQEARDIFDFIAASLPVDRDRVNFEILAEERMPENSVGFYQLRDEESSALKPKSTIYLADSELNVFVSTVSTLAHELAHEALLGKGIVTGHEYDHERLTDLLPSFFGYGIFTANNTVETAYWHDVEFTYSAWQQKGYLSSLELGHALALFCWLRREQSPSWISRLRPDAAKTLKASLRFLERSGDALLTPANLSPSHATGDEAHAPTAQSATHRLASIWDAEQTDAGIDNVTRLLSDPELAIRQEALNFIYQIEHVPDSALPALEQSVSDPDQWCQAMATWILTKQGVSSIAVSDSVCWLLLHSDKSCASMTQLAASALAKTDPTFLENEKVVDRVIWIAASGIPGAESGQPDFECDYEEEGYSQSALRLHQTLAAIPNLPEVLKHRFPTLNSTKVVEFARRRPFSQSDLDKRGF